MVQGTGEKITDIKKSFNSLLQLAGIKTTAEVKAQGLPRMKGFWFHCLRHTFASNLVMKGVPSNLKNSVES